MKKWLQELEEEEEEEEDELEEMCFAEKRNKRENREDMSESIIKIAEEIKDEIETIIEKPLSKESIGACMMVDEELIDKLKDLIYRHVTSCSREENNRKRKKRGEEIKRILYLRLRDGTGTYTDDPLVINFVDIGGEEGYQQDEDSMMHR